MPVYDDNLLKAVSAQLVQRLLQHVPNQCGRIGDGARLMASFVDLAEVVPGENHRILLPGRTQRYLPGNKMRFIILYVFINDLSLACSVQS